MVNAAVQPVLRVENLSAGWPGARGTLKNVNFEVLPGERVGVIGPNGAGKSTLFKAMVNLLPLENGRISIHNRDCRSSHAMIGYVPQYENIDWNFPVTVRDVVMMGRLRQIGWFRLPFRRDWQKIDEALNRVGMAEFGRRQIGELSGGQRRRVFIARALAQETDVLLLDEPFNGVDASAEQEISRVLDNLRADGVTTILATHDLSQATTYFDKLLLLRGGIIAYGVPQQVFTPEHLTQAYGGRLGIFHEGGETIIITDEHLHASHKE